MGFGDNFLGESMFGLSPQDTPAPRVVPKFQAYDFDVRTRDVLVDNNGFYKSVHPVDHFVQLNLSVNLGAVPADTSVGSTILETQFDTDEIMTADMTRRVRTALKRLIDNDDLTLISVKTSGAYGIGGRIVFDVEYENLRLPEGERLRRQTFELSP